jgi:hypothetical protein
MENPNIGLIYEALGAYQSGDQRRLRELIDPDIEVRVRFHIYVTVDEALDVARGLAEGRE